jgi:hypothetical protein
VLQENGYSELIEKLHVSRHDQIALPIVTVPVIWQNGLKPMFSVTKSDHFVFVVKTLVFKGTVAEAVRRSPKVHETVHFEATNGTLSYHRTPLIQVHLVLIVN